jgi:hypothetical protein
VNGTLAAGFPGACFSSSSRPITPGHSYHTITIYYPPELRSVGGL